MTRVVRFPARPAAPVAIGGLKCVECGGAPMLFVDSQRAGVPHVWAFCGPACAAGCGVEPWASTGLVERMAWATRGELEAVG